MLSLPEARWAAVATVLFLIALPLQLTGAPAWAWGPLYALAYATGGWEPAWAGLQALKEKTLDVDLLMIVAALGAAAVGQVMDGALLIVIFATSGALEALATARTADAVIVRDELATVPAVVALSRRARSFVVQNLVIASLFITALVVWDLVAALPLPLGVLGHEGSTVIVGLNGLRLLREAAWTKARGQGLAPTHDPL